jgi:hypothetical protein
MGLCSSAASLPDFSSLVAQFLVNQATLRDVLSGIASFLRADHFALVRYPPDRQSCYVVSSDIPTFHPQNWDLRNGTAIDIPPSSQFLLLASQPLNFDVRIRSMAAAVITNSLTACPYDISFLLHHVSLISPAEGRTLEQRGFSLTRLNDDELFEIALSLFVRSSLIENLRVNRLEFVRFLIELRTLYNNVPYHNWNHAVDVAQFTFSLICNAKVGNYLEPIELFALLVAAICHDADHDGRNNVFQRKAGTIHAHLAPNLPPLEAHHIAVSINLLNLRYPRVFQSWPKEDICTFEKFMSACILATDMEKHQFFINSFKEVRGDLDRSNPAHRLLLAQIILKSADLSNTVRNFETAAESTDNLMNEFFFQGDYETELGLEISPMCDRKTAAPTPVGQIGFYKFVAGPLFAELHAFFPELAENEQQYESNLAQWTALKDAL